jgi:hypothetical protein
VARVGPLQFDRLGSHPSAASVQLLFPLLLILRYEQARPAAINDRPPADGWGTGEPDTPNTGLTVWPSTGCRASLIRRP